MQKWEYEYIDVQADWLSEELNTHGNQGWELVAVQKILAGFLLFFKRPKQPE